MRHLNANFTATDECHVHRKSSVTAPWLRMVHLFAGDVSIRCEGSAGIDFCFSRVGFVRCALGVDGSNRSAGKTSMNVSRSRARRRSVPSMEFGMLCDLSQRCRNAVLRQDLWLIKCPCSEGSWKFFRQSLPALIDCI